MAKTIGTYKIRVSSTKYKKNLKKGEKEYDYGSISIKNPSLAEYIGQMVIVKVLKSDEKKRLENVKK